jgi:TatD DNase family protein
MLFFDVHTHSSSTNKNVFSILNKYPSSLKFTQPFSIGIHPWFMNTENIESELLLIEEKVISKNCFAIGECGLDKLIAIDFELQLEIFRKQVQLSEKHRKPLIIHCVKAHQDIIRVKKELKPKQTWILHGFHKNIQIAESLLLNGIILSFGKAILQNIKLQEVVLKISLENILLETDDSEIEIQKMYQKVAEIKKIEVEKLQEVIENDFKRIFRV